MGALAKTIYVFAFIVSIIYFLIKLKKRKYIFSVFNISCLIYLFSFMITPVFYNESQAWYALGVTNHKIYYEYLDKCVVINGVGLILTYLTTGYIEFYSNIGKVKTVQKYSSFLKEENLNLFFPIVVIGWYALVLIFNKGLPIFNHNRTFFLHQSFSIFYLLLNELLLVYAIYYGVLCIYSEKRLKNCLKWLICIITLFFTGNRGSVLIGSIVPIFILLIYEYTRKKQLRKIKNETLREKYDESGKWRNKAFKYIVILLFVIGFIGLVFGALRYSGIKNLSPIINEMLYGNTFSDIRDGAFILKGFETKFNGEPLLGKTYLAGFLSFLPGSVVPFKTEWLYGNFTTVKLFNWQNHFGLRGGNVFEAYLNFGYFGVVIFAVLQGVLNGYLEKMFYKIFLNKNSLNKSKSYLILYIFSILNNFLVCTAAFYLIYFDLIFYMLISIKLRSSSRRIADEKICN